MTTKQLIDRALKLAVEAEAYAADERPLWPFIQKAAEADTAAQALRDRCAALEQVAKSASAGMRAAHGDPDRWGDYLLRLDVALAALDEQTGEA